MIDHKSDDNGHWVMAVVESNSVYYICMSNMLEGWKTPYVTDQIIIGGDFNMVPDLWLDRMPPKGKCHNYDETVFELVTRLGLAGYWRMHNPSTQQYTWFNAASNGQCSRLDCWLISDHLINCVSKCEISASPLTDHVWKSNDMLLENGPFCIKVRHLIGEIAGSEMSN